MKRRDITFGMVQNECRMVSCDCKKCGAEVKAVCNQLIDNEGCVRTPRKWDLTDPPRFTDAQMALLNGMWEAGARKMIYHPDVDGRWIKFEREDRTMIALVEMIALGYECVKGAYEHHLLAELLGKDGTDGE